MEVTIALDVIPHLATHIHLEHSSGETLLSMIHRHGFGKKKLIHRTIDLVVRRSTFISIIKLFSPNA